jgi:hypothetical protein
MMFLWATCGVPFGAYSIVQNFNVPIQVQPQCFMGLCLVSWAQVLVYGRGWRAWAAAVMGVAVAAACAGVEAALILTLRVSAVLILHVCYKLENKVRYGGNTRMYLFVSCSSVFVPMKVSRTRMVADNRNSRFTWEATRRRCWSWVYWHLCSLLQVFYRLMARFGKEEEG